jgi:hypothetical protein
MEALLAGVVVAVGLATVGVWATRQVLAAIQSVREDAGRTRTLQIVALLAPGAREAIDDPRQLLVWHPLAESVRVLCPQECGTIDRAAGRRFPFGDDDVQAAHARWTSDWLAWEQAHDATYKLKAAEAASATDAREASGRARIDAIEREKLAAYQRRYEEYANVSRRLQALAKAR